MACERRSAVGAHFPLHGGRRGWQLAAVKVAVPPASTVWLAGSWSRRRSPRQRGGGAGRRVPTLLVKTASYSLPLSPLVP